MKSDRAQVMSEKQNIVHHNVTSDDEKPNEVQKPENHDALSYSGKQEGKWKDRFITIVITILFISLPTNLIWQRILDSSEKKTEFTNFSKELKYNIGQLKKTDVKLLEFEDYFKTKYNLTIKRWKSGFPMPIPLQTTRYRVEPINKDDPIWNLIKKMTDKPLLTNGVYSRFSEEGLIYKFKDEDVKFLKKLYSDFQSKVDVLLDEVFSELKNFPERSPVISKKETAEIYKKKLEKQKDMIVKKIQEIRKQITENVGRLENINNSTIAIIG